MTSEYLLSPCGILISLINKYVGVIKRSKKNPGRVRNFSLLHKINGIFFLKNNERVYEFIRVKKRFQVI